MHRDQKHGKSNRKEIQESKNCFCGETRDCSPKAWTEMRSRDGAYRWQQELGRQELNH